MIDQNRNVQIIGSEIQLVVKTGICIISTAVVDAVEYLLYECNGINDGEYYLAWKAVTDNTSPMIRSVKIVDTAI